MPARPSHPLAAVHRKMERCGRLCSVVFTLSLAAGAAHASMIGTGLGPQVIAVGDLNEDGYADLISGNDGDSTVTVSLGRGNGTFDPKVQYACASPPSSLALSDLDGDGHLDLASACPGVGVVRIRFGAGDGTLGAPTDRSASGQPVAVVAANFNNQTDSFMDLLMVNYPTGNALSILRGTGGGAFTLGVFISPFRSVHLAAGDVDNDGHPDLVFANAVDSVAIFRGSGTGTFLAPLQRYQVQGAPSTVAIADLNQDGKPDVVAAIPSANALNVMLGNGDGTFAPYLSIPAGTSPRWIATGDFNGDNIPDLAVTATGGSTVAILIGTGSGTFQPKVDYPAGLATAGVAVTQLDGDANADLAVAASGQNSICTLPGNGNGTFQTPSGAVYVWNTTTGTMTDPNAWRPARNTALGTDVLVINRGGGFGIGAVSGSAGQIVVSGGTSVSFSALGFGTSTLNLLGGPGVDLAVERSSTLNISTFTSPVQLNIAAGAMAEINGDVILAGASNRLQAVSTNGILFQSTGRAFIEDSGSPAGTITPFGTGTGASGLNSVQFLFGSQCIANYPVSLFGTAAPNAVVKLGPGSRYRQTAAFPPDVSGRTYGDFEYNVPGGASVMSGSGAFQVDSLVVAAGTLISQLTGPVTVRGNIAVACDPTAAALKFLPASPMTLRLAGSALQRMRPNDDCATSRLFYLKPNVTLNIDNPAGVEFVDGFTTSASLSFTHGNIYTRRVNEHPLLRYRIVIDSTGTVTGAGSSTGWVGAPLMRYVTADGVIRLDVGDSLSYQPVDLNLHGVTGPGYIYAATASQDHWELSSAQLDMAHLAHRSWVLWAANTTLGAAGTYLSNADATLSFAPPDLSPGADPLQFVPRMWSSSGGWSEPAAGLRTSSSIQLPGLPVAAIANAPSFQIGQPITPSLSVFSGSASEGTGAAPSRIQPTQAQTAGSLAFRVRLSQAAIVPVSVDFQTVDGTATTADGDYTPASGTLNFAAGDTAHDIVVPFGVDATPERNETFGIALSNASNATIATPTATGTILDDDDLIAPTATVVFPNGGEVILQNQQVNLQWTASDNVAVSGVDVQIVNGSIVTTLASNYPNTGSYAWLASGAASTKMKFRVVAHDDPGHATTDNSDANWTLSAEVMDAGDLPLAFALAPLSPNPARGGSRIAFTVPHEAKVRLTVLDVQGRTVATLADGVVPAGRHQRAWDASARAAAGVYFVRFEAPGFGAERRMVLLH